MRFRGAALLAVVVLIGGFRVTRPRSWARRWTDNFFLIQSVRTFLAWTILTGLQLEYFERKVRKVVQRVATDKEVCRGFLVR